MFRSLLLEGVLRLLGDPAEMGGRPASTCGRVRHEPQRGSSLRRGSAKGSRPLNVCERVLWFHGCSRCNTATLAVSSHSTGPADPASPLSHRSGQLASFCTGRNYWRRSCTGSVSSGFGCRCCGKEAGSGMGLVRCLAAVFQEAGIAAGDWVRVTGNVAGTLAHGARLFQHTGLNSGSKPTSTMPQVINRLPNPEYTQCSHAGDYAVCRAPPPPPQRLLHCTRSVHPVLQTCRPEASTQIQSPNPRLLSQPQQCLHRLDLPHECS